jgi:hypothetical protein
MHKPVVLLTATINCEDVILVDRRDRELREADYRWAIEGWMGVDGYDTLIFCENSGADLAKLEEYAASINKFEHRLIFLSCRKNAGARERGKGYGEMEIIRHAIDTVAELGPEQMILKVTGRYRARNAAHLISELKVMQGDIFCGMRFNLTFSNSGVFAITVNCFREYLLPQQESLDDSKGKCFEHVLADAVHATILSGGRWSPLPCDPSLYGFSGSQNMRFGYSYLSRLKSHIKGYLSRKAFSTF